MQSIKLVNMIDLIGMNLLLSAESANQLFSLLASLTQILFKSFKAQTVIDWKLESWDL